MPKAKRKSFTRVKRHTRPSESPNNTSQDRSPIEVIASRRRSRPGALDEGSEDEDDDLGRTAPLRVQAYKKGRENAPIAATVVEDEDDSEDLGEEQDELSVAKFAALEPRQRYVKPEVIKSKWSVLPDTTQERVRSLFASIETPLLNRNRDDRRRIETQLALKSVGQMLGRRLSRMPFPPSTKDWHFDYESLLKANRDLEQQLAPTLHSTALLRSEIDKGQELLAADDADLEALERNAKAQEAVRTRREKNRHDLLRMSRNSDAMYGADVIGFVPKGRKTQSSLDTELHQSLMPIAEQLQSHLTSIEGNTTQVDGISNEIAMTMAGLDATLHQRLDSAAYDQILTA